MVWFGNWYGIIGYGFYGILEGLYEFQDGFYEFQDGIHGFMDCSS